MLSYLNMTNNVYFVFFISRIKNFLKKFFILKFKYLVAGNFFINNIWCNTKKSKLFTDFLPKLGVEFFCIFCYY